MNLNGLRSGEQKKSSVERSAEYKLPKKKSTKKLDREHLLNNFPLFTSSISQPNIFSILNINYNKCKDNNIITINNGNHFSSKNDVHSTLIAPHPKQNFKDLKNANLLNSKKTKAFFESGNLGNLKAFQYDRQDSKPMKRNFSQKSNVSKSKNSGEWRMTSKFEVVKQAKSMAHEDCLNMKARANVKSKAQSIKTPVALRAGSQKSLKPFDRNPVHTTSSKALINADLLNSLAAFKNKFGKFLSSLPY